MAAQISEYFFHFVMFGSVATQYRNTNAIVSVYFCLKYENDRKVDKCISNIQKIRIVDQGIPHTMK